MLQVFLIVAWIAGLSFFIWEFIYANSLPGFYADLEPWAFRVGDIVFGAVILLTLYYLITER